MARKHFQSAGADRRYFPKSLLTPSEHAFFHLLQRALPEYRVLPQVCMGALVDPRAGLWGKYRERARYTYQSKIVDFTIWDASLNKVVCLVELDDPSHDDRKDQDDARDAITAQAGYPTVRVDVRAQPAEDALRDLVLNAKPATPTLSRDATTPFSQQGSSRRAGAGQASFGNELARRLFALLLILVLGFLGLRLLPSLGTWVAQRFASSMSHSVGASATASAQRGNAKQAVPQPSQSVQIDRPKCMVYEDRAAISRSVSAGCVYRETTSFQPSMSPALFNTWYRYNLARLNGASGCEAYPQWAGELLVDAQYPAQERFQRLDQLFNDAVVKGCMRAPRLPL